MKQPPEAVRAHSATRRVAHFAVNAVALAAALAAPPLLAQPQQPRSMGVAPTPAPAVAPAPAPVYPAAPGAPGTPLPGQSGQAASSSNPNMPPLVGVPSEIRDGGRSARRTALDDALPDGLENEVKELRRRMDNVQRAGNANMAQPKPVSRSITITQAAGEEPPAVRVTQGIPTTIVMTDSTGMPWPIEFALPGDERQFEIIIPGADGSALQIRPLGAYSYGGISVKLRGNPIPMSIVLSAAQKEVDARLDVKISRRGPNAAAPVIDRLNVNTAASDALLQSFLDGVPPNGSRELKTSMNQVRAWLLGDRLYVRSSLSLASPAWSDSTSSPDGVTRAYILPAVPSVLVSNNGRMVAVSIGE